MLTRTEPPKDQDKDKDQTLKDKDQGQTFKDKDKVWPHLIFKP